MSGLCVLNPSHPNPHSLSEDTQTYTMAMEMKKDELALAWENIREEIKDQGRVTLKMWKLDDRSTPRLARMVLRDICLRAAADVEFQDLGLEVHVNWETTVASFAIRGRRPTSDICPFPTRLVERVRGAPSYTTIIRITPEEASAARRNMAGISCALQTEISISWVDGGFYLAWGTEAPRFPALGDPSWDAPIQQKQ